MFSYTIDYADDTEAQAMYLCWVQVSAVMTKTVHPLVIYPLRQAERPSSDSKLLSKAPAQSK